MCGSTNKQYQSHLCPKLSTQSCPPRNPLSDGSDMRDNASRFRVAFGCARLISRGSHCTSESRSGFQNPALDFRPGPRQRASRCRCSAAPRRANASRLGISE
eukprot:3676822-Rhodomonas_salina.1